MLNVVHLLNKKERGLDTKRTDTTKVEAFLTQFDENRSEYAPKIIKYSNKLIPDDYEQALFDEVQKKSPQYFGWISILKF